MINDIARRVVIYARAYHKAPSGSFMAPWRYRSSISESSGFVAFYLIYDAGVLPYVCRLASDDYTFSIGFLGLKDVVERLQRQ